MILSVSIVLFMLLQIGAAILFKWGTMTPTHYWPGFLLGNALGIVSILALMNIYKVLPPNLAAAVCTGGSFLCIQLALAVVFHAAVSVSTVGGTLLILSGILWMTLATVK